MLRYVRVEHGPVALKAVGRGTVVEHLEVAYASGTSGLELCSGTVDLRYLSVLFASGAALTVSGPYSGRVQFLFAMLGTEGTHGVISGASTDLRLSSATILGGGTTGISQSLVQLSESAS